MIYYFFTICISVIVAFFHEIIKEKYLKKFLFLFLVFFISLLPGLRSSLVGSDSMVYADIFETKLLNIFGGFEPGFNLFIIIFQNLNIINYSFYFLFFSFVTNFFILYSIFRLSSYKITSVVLYLTLSTLYLFEFNVIRQALAISIFLFSMVFLVENKFKKTYFLILVAVLFHYSALFLIVIVLLYHKFKDNIFLLNLMSFIMVLTLNFLFVIFLNLAIFFIGREGVYLNYTDTSTEVGLRFIFLINLVIYLSLWFAILFSKKIFYNEIFKIGLMLFTFLIAFNFSITFLGMRYEGVGRIMNYFFIAYFIAIPELIGLFKIKDRMILAIFVILISIIYSFSLVNITNINGIFPYQFSSWLL